MTEIVEEYEEFEEEEEEEIEEEVSGPLTTHWFICICPKLQVFLYFHYYTSLVFVVSSLNLIKTLDMISFVWVHWDYLLELQVQWQALWIVKLVTPSSQQFMEPVSHVCRGGSCFRQTPSDGV